MSGDRELKSGKAPAYVRDCVEGGPFPRREPHQCVPWGRLSRGNCPCPGTRLPLPSAQTLAASSAAHEVRAEDQHSAICSVQL